MMARYIDADIALEKMKNWHTKERLMDCVRDTPAVDVVKVVRCKDCAVPHNRWIGCPKLNGLVTPPDFYCSYGEMRKEDGGNES